MQDRPDSRELVEAVAAFLEKEIAPILTDPRLRFRGLIAANVLNIVARELAAGDEPLRAEWERLVALLHEPSQVPPRDHAALVRHVMVLNEKLCDEIRTHKVDDDAWFDKVMEHVQATVIQKLRVTNPRYLERVSEG